MTRMFLMIFVLVSMAANAQAGQGWYVSGQGGASFLQDADLDDPTGILLALDTEVSFETGFNFAAATGYDWGAWRAEAEIAYAKNDIDEFSILGLGVDGGGDVSALSFMANGFYDFDLAPWTVYIGGGAGIAKVSINDADVLGIPLADDDDTVFAYQVGAGAEYAFNPNASLVLGYRFFSTADPDFNDVTGIPFSSEYHRHDTRLGVRFYF